MPKMELPVVLDMPGKYYQALKELAASNEETPQEMAMRQVTHDFEQVLYTYLENYIITRDHYKAQQN